MARPYKLTTEFRKLDVLIEVLSTYRDTCAKMINEARQGHPIDTDRFRTHLSITEVLFERLVKRTVVRVKPKKATIQFEWHEGNVIYHALLSYQSQMIGDDLQQSRVDQLKNNIHQIIS